MDCKIKFTCPFPSISLNVGDNGFCYLFNLQPETFDSAEYTCQTKGGHLIQINDQFTNTFVVSKSSFD